jgi:hypothetical protein
MNEMKKKNLRFESIAWGCILILIAGFELVPGNQGAEAVLGIGVILLGLNLVRYLNKIPVNAFSTTLGFLAFGLGTLISLHLFHLQVPFFTLVLFVIGLYLLFPQAKMQNDG